VTLSIAVAGKGGVGKTTLCGLLVRSLRDLGVRPILAVDADPTSNLAEALGVEAGKALADIREEGSTPEGSPSSGLGRVRAVEDELQRAIVEADGFDLITMGRPEGPRCYCAVNHLLRRSLDNLPGNYRAVVLDNEAGMEHLSRRTTNDVDVLLVVANPSTPSLRAAKRILSLARELPVRIGRRVVVFNRVGPEGIAESFARELGELESPPLLIPQDNDVELAGAAGRDVFGLPAQTPALAAMLAAAKVLLAQKAATSEPATT
jgi:CO dehydrogenase maturation factor